MPNCLSCNDSIFEVKNIRFDLKLKKQTVEVIVPCNICKNCNGTLMDSEQMNTLRRAAADRYREINGLLTSKMIIAYREKFGLAQIGFARFLNVGEASIKRWETYCIQDESQDDHIRLKCDPIYSESNSFYLQSRYSDIYSGLKSFSSYLVKQVSSFFEQLHPDCLISLRRLHFYSDFLHFKRHNRSITGMRYTPLKSGPAPHNYKQLSQFVRCKNFYSPKIENFDDDEKKTIDDICNLFRRDNGQMICILSAQERGFLETNEDEFISYEYAKDLLI